MALPWGDREIFADRYRLLDRCGAANTFSGDGDGIYHPGLFNDRRGLGLKGTRSEAGLQVLRARLNGGIPNQAERGELRRGLAATQPKLVWLHFSSWRRPKRSPGCPAEFVVATAWRHHLPNFLPACPNDPACPPFRGPIFITTTVGKRRWSSHGWWLASRPG